MTIYFFCTFSSHSVIGMPWIEVDIFSRSRMIWIWPGRNPAFHLTALWKPQSAFTACSVGVKTFCLSYSGIPVRLSKLAQRARLKTMIQRRGSKAAELCHTWTYALLSTFSPLYPLLSLKPSEKKCLKLIVLFVCTQTDVAVKERQNPAHGWRVLQPCIDAQCLSTPLSPFLSHILPFPYSLLVIARRQYIHSLTHPHFRNTHIHTSPHLLDTTHEYAGAGAPLPVTAHYCIETCMFMHFF